MQLVVALAVAKSRKLNSPSQNLVNTMAFSKIIVAAIALMLASASAFFMAPPAAALQRSAVRSAQSSSSLRMSAGGDGSNPSHEEYVEKAKEWAAKNTHLSDAAIKKTIEELKTSHPEMDHKQRFKAATEAWSKQKG